MPAVQLEPSHAVQSKMEACVYVVKQSGMSVLSRIVEIVTWLWLPETSVAGSCIPTAADTVTVPPTCAAAGLRWLSSTSASSL